jgi:hypothetical protein
MSTAQKVLVVYLCISSVILHILLGLLLYFLLIPAFSSGWKMADEFARAKAADPDQMGTIQDISVLEDGESRYIGYAIEYKDKPLYVMGAPTEDFAKGDRVAVIVNKAPFPGPQKLLFVTLIRPGK